MGVPEPENTFFVPEGGPKLSPYNVLNDFPRVVAVSNREVCEVLKALIQGGGVGCRASLSRVGGEIRVIKKEQTTESPECKPKVVKPDMMINEYKTLVFIVDRRGGAEVGDRHRPLYNITDLKIKCVTGASGLEVVVRFYLDVVDPGGEVYLVGLVERTPVVLNGKPYLPSLTADAEEHPPIALKLHKVPSRGVVCIGYVRTVRVEREGYAKVVGPRVAFFIPPRRPVSSGPRLLVSRTRGSLRGISPEI